MNKIIGGLLLILAIYLGYTGITMYQESTAAIEILGLEINASEADGKNTSFIYLGFALISSIAGIILLIRK